MKYIIKRTSVRNKEKPCDEAFKHPHEKWHTMFCTEEEFNKRFSSSEGLWRDKGTNHTTTEEGWITRQEPDTIEWTIEINSLEELNAFAEKYGHLVVSPAFKDIYFFSEKNGHLVVSPEAYSNKSPEIEIYDDYRE